MNEEVIDLWKFPLTPMGVPTPRSANSRPTGQPSDSTGGTLKGWILNECKAGHCKYMFLVIYMCGMCWLTANYYRSLNYSVKNDWGLCYSTKPPPSST